MPISLPRGEEDYRVTRHFESAQNMQAKPERKVVALSAPGFEPDKMLSLIRHPNNSLKLNPEQDWLYGIIGAAMGVVGFTFWFWAAQRSMIRSLSLFEDLVYGAAVGKLPWGKLLGLGVLSMVLLTAVMTVAGNRIGGRKREWMEAIAFHGGAQAWFGAAFAVTGVIGLWLWKPSLLIMLALLLLNLALLLARSIELHEVEGGRLFAFLGTVMGIYAAVVGIAAALSF